MQWQYDPQKAQLEHKAHICAKFHNRKYNSLRTVVRKRKCEARPLDRQPTHPPARPPLVKSDRITSLWGIHDEM